MSKDPTKWYRDCLPNCCQMCDPMTLFPYRSARCQPNTEGGERRRAPEKWGHGAPEIPYSVIHQIHPSRSLLVSFYWITRKTFLQRPEIIQGSQGRGVSGTHLLPTSPASFHPLPDDFFLAATNSLSTLILKEAKKWSCVKIRLKSLTLCKAGKCSQNTYGNQFELLGKVFSMSHTLLNS
jgi:hypothetical protein